MDIIPTLTVYIQWHIKLTHLLTGSHKNARFQFATTPTEDDWFDIYGTTSLQIASIIGTVPHFTGNFVWVRAKAIPITAGFTHKYF